MLNRNQAPNIQPMAGIQFVQPVHYTLSNGIRVFEYKAGTQDVLSVEVVYSAGSWYQSKPMLAMATNMMLREGTVNHDAAMLSELLDFYGAHLENATERDSAYVSLYTLTRHLEHTLPLLADMCNSPLFPEKELQVFLGKQRQMLEINRQKVNFLARAHFNPLLFGENHPYGAMLLPQHIDQVSADDLKQFHAKYYSPENCMILVSGKVPDTMQVLLEQYFGVQKANRIMGFPDVDAAQTNAKLVNHLYKDGALQSAIRMGKLMFTRRHPDYHGMKVLNTILGGYFGSRLMLNLREDKGYTYGVGSAVVPLRHEGFFAISCEVGSEVTSEALKEINFELLRLCDEKVSDSELSLVRNYLSGELLRSVDGPFAQANLFRELVEDGLDSAFFEETIHTINTITASQLQDLAIRYLNPEKMLKLVVGKQSVDEA